MVSSFSFSRPVWCWCFAGCGLWFGGGGGGRSLESRQTPTWKFPRPRWGAGAVLAFRAEPSRVQLGPPVCRTRPCPTPSLPWGGRAGADKRAISINRSKSHGTNLSQGTVLPFDFPHPSLPPFRRYFPPPFLSSTTRMRANFLPLSPLDVPDRLALSTIAGPSGEPPAVVCCLAPRLVWRASHISP